MRGRIPAKLPDMGEYSAMITRGARGACSAPNPITVRCNHCGAIAGEPCQSVGGRPIVDPHMQRMRAIGADGLSAAARDAYARAVVARVFGHCTPELLARARKDRAIDGTKAWVRRELNRSEWVQAELPLR